MPAALIPAIIGGASSLGSAVIGSHASGSAADKYNQAIEQAIQEIQSSTKNAQGEVNNLYSPYADLGTEGLKGLEGSGLFSPTTYNTTGDLGSKSLNEQWATPFNAPTAQQVADTPGYQFAKEAGMNAIQGSAAANGNLLSGGTMKGLQGYETGLANQYYQQAYNNALQQYMDNYNIFNQNQSNQFNRLTGVTGIGLTGANALGNADVGLAENSSQSIANLLAGKGTTDANAGLSSGSAWMNGLGGVANAAELWAMNKNNAGAATGSGYNPAGTGMGLSPYGPTF